MKSHVEVILGMFGLSRALFVRNAAAIHISGYQANGSLNARVAILEQP